MSEAVRVGIAPRLTGERAAALGQRADGAAGVFDGLALVAVERAAARAVHLAEPLRSLLDVVADAVALAVAVVGD